MDEKSILESILDYFKPKAHDAIDAITARWEESKSSPITQLPPELQETIQGMAMGVLGGGSKVNTLKNLSRGLPGPLTRREMYGLKTLQDPETKASTANLIKDLIRTGNYEKISKHWANFPPNKPGSRWFNKPYKK